MNNEIAARMMWAMDEAGMTQADLARASGVSQSSISKYLAGKVVPSVVTFVQIANTLGVAVPWLVLGDTRHTEPHYVDAKTLDYTRLKIDVKRYRKNMNAAQKLHLIKLILF